MLYKNKKAYFNYEIIDEYVAGIKLLGTEVKSIRDGKVSFNDSYCVIKNNECWILGLHISEYSLGTCNNHEPLRDKKILLTKKEIKKIHKKISEKGLTLVPLKIFDKNGLIKILIGVAKGKKLWDKKESIKKKDMIKEMKI